MFPRSLRKTFLSSRRNQRLGNDLYLKERKNLQNQVFRRKSKKREGKGQKSEETYLNLSDAKGALKGILVTLIVLGGKTQRILNIRSQVLSLIWLLHILQMSALYAFSVVLRQLPHTQWLETAHLYLSHSFCGSGIAYALLKFSVLTTGAVFQQTLKFESSYSSTCMIITNILLVRIKSHFPHTLNGRIVLRDVNTRRLP